MTEIFRGDIWEYDPDPVRGREQGKKIRPSLIISNNAFNKSLAELVMVIPLTTKNRGIECHVRIEPRDAHVRKVSFAMCDQIRSISKDRLTRRLGSISNLQILDSIEEWIADLLDLK